MYYCFKIRGFGFVPFDSWAVGILMLLVIVLSFLFPCFIVSELAEDDVLRVFLRERQLNGDFISKACDKFWQRGVAEFVDVDDDKLSDIPQGSEQVQ